jgi:transposase-like protein
MIYDDFESKPYEVQKCPRCGSETIMGIEVSGVYDGVLFWHCYDCKKDFPRKGDYFMEKYKSLTDIFRMEDGEAEINGHKVCYGPKEKEVD